MHAQGPVSARGPVRGRAGDPRTEDTLDGSSTLYRGGVPTFPETAEWSREAGAHTVPRVPLGRLQYTEAVAPPCAELGVIHQLKVLTAPPTPTELGALHPELCWDHCGSRSSRAAGRRNNPLKSRSPTSSVFLSDLLGGQEPILPPSRLVAILEIQIAVAPCGTQGLQSGFGAKL